MVVVQEHAFDVGTELARLKAGRTDIGGTAIFVGSVRDVSDGENVSAMTLEHYPGMTEKALADIETEARSRFQIYDILIIHRFGILQAGEDIVLVIACAGHRQAAFNACEFLMDWLKTKAPFWKLESGTSGTRWVDTNVHDAAASSRWTQKHD